MCNISVTCLFSKKVCLKDRFTCLQIVQRIYDPEKQEKVLTAGTAISEGQEMRLTNMIKMGEVSTQGGSTDFNSNILAISGSGARIQDGVVEGNSCSGCEFCGQVEVSPTLSLRRVKMLGARQGRALQAIQAG